VSPQACLDPPRQEARSNGHPPAKPLTAARGRVVRLLDADPDLGRGLTPEQRAQARRVAVATLVTLDRGSWVPSEDGPPRALGFLVLSGALLRDVRVADRWCSELLGPGDVLRPHEPFEPESLASDSAWTVLEPVRLARLDGRFAAVAGRWPALLEELLSRTFQRSWALAAMRGLSSIPRLEVRLALLLRIVADRWGRVVPEGVVVPLPLTHETLARLSGAQRPSVTAALGRMTERGSLQRTVGRGWLLPHEPLDEPWGVEARLAS
jgi:CRP-like cAMP-binding protein